MKPWSRRVGMIGRISFWRGLVRRKGVGPPRNGDIHNTSKNHEWDTRQLGMGRDLFIYLRSLHED